MTKSLDPTTGCLRVCTTERLPRDPCPQKLGVCACVQQSRSVVRAFIVRRNDYELTVSVAHRVFHTLPEKCIVYMLFRILK